MMIHAFVLASVSLTFALTTSPSHALTVFHCGPSDGHVYYPAGPEQPGYKDWEDEVDPRTISLILENGNYDIVSEQGDQVFSARKLGAKIEMVIDDRQGILFSVIWPRERVESYHFRQSDPIELVWTVNRSGFLLGKVQAFKAKCARGGE